MSEAAEFVVLVEHDKAAARQIAQKTARKLEAKKTSLITVVESLGDYINDENAEIRTRAVSYLTSVLTELPSKYLSRQQIQVLCQFFCDRIEDGGALEGLDRLQGLDRFTTEMAQMTARALLEHFQDLQQRPQSGRYQILLLLNALLSRHRKALLPMGEELLVGATDLVGGEKDPRNLMLIFSILRVLMVEWDITKHLEIMFDSVYAYFPITFRPPPNDPHGVTAQDLKDRLRDCVASTGRLAPYAIPNLLDKLDSTSVVVKKDVIRTLAACADNYDLHTMSQYSITLWDSLKFEILNAQEPELADETLLALQAIVMCLSKDQADVSPKSPLAQYLRPIAKECNEHLQEPTNRQAKAAGEILGRLCSSDSLAQSFLVKLTLPPLLTLYQDVGTIPKQRALLEILNTLLESAVIVFGTWVTPGPTSSAENIYGKFKDQLLEMYSQALMGTIRDEVSFRCTAAHGLLKLSKVRGLLQENEIGLVVQYFDEILLKEDHFGEDNLKRLAMESLADISKHKPRLIMDITFPAFMAQLPDTDAEAEVNDNHLTILESLAAISVEREPLDTLLRRLLNKVDVLLARGNADHPTYTRAILSTIFFVLDRQTQKSDPGLANYYDRIVVGFTRKALLPRAGSGAQTALNHESVLGILGQLSNLIIRNLPLEKQVGTTQDVYRLFTPELSQENSIPSPSHKAYCEKVLLSTWVLAALPRGVLDPFFDPTQIQDRLLQLKDLSLHEESITLKPMLLRQMSLYVNKHLSTADLHAVSSMLGELYQSLKSTTEASKPNADYTLSSQPPIETIYSSFSAELPKLSNTLRLIFAITSALTNRLASTTTENLNSLLTLLDLPRPLSALSAHGFSTLLSSDPILSSENYYQIRKLVPQRVLSTLLPSIAAGIRSSSTSNKPASSSSSSTHQRRANFLTALSSLLPQLHPSILLPHLDTLIPLLLQCLDVGASETVASANISIDPTAPLTTLSALIPLAGPSLASSGHLHSLTTRLLALTSSPQPAQIRVLSTRALGMLPVYLKGVGEGVGVGGIGGGERELIKEKGRAMAGLERGLDDRKRDVRREAVLARVAWEKGVGGEESEGDDE